jgi:hypothetical protein
MIAEPTISLPPATVPPKLWLFQPKSTMDGLSTGASVIAVVSLAAQLGAGAHTLIKFLETVSDAPAEIQRLENLLDQIYAIATCVRNALEHQRRLHGNEHILADDIHTSLLNCHKKVQRIERLVDRFKETDRLAW